MTRARIYPIDGRFSQGRRFATAFFRLGENMGKKVSREKGGKNGGSPYKSTNKWPKIRRETESKMIGRHVESQFLEPILT